MSFREPPARRREQAGERQPLRLEQLAALGSLAVVVVVVLVLVLSSLGGGSGSGAPNPLLSGTTTRHRTGSASKSRPGAQPAATSVPILVYHVINVPPPQSAADPALYVSSAEFASQMNALKSGGWHAVTLDQVEANWTRGSALGPGKPIVLSFDNGYASHYTNAAPVLKQLGWVGVEDLQLTGLPPAQGGLADSQIRGLLTAGWELDAQGVSHADLITLGPTQLNDEVATARQTLRSRYGVAANWFSYPLGHYNATVIAAVRSAGYVGATTVNPGWASGQQDRYRLPRLPVAGGTTASQLLAQIASAQGNATNPASYSGPGLA
jgi:peptidoglycan/xylan/chitin deacetylase (PgdA/CDA1 family)